MSNAEKCPELVDLHVGGRIRARRKEMGLSQQCLAEKLDLSVQQVQKYECALNRVSASTLFEITVSLRTSVAYFFEGLADHGAAAVDHEAELHAFEFLATPEGVELASQFQRVRSGLIRRRIVDLVRALVEEDAAPGITEG